MPEDDIRKYGLQIVEAIAYIHSQNILHREYSLPNLASSCVTFTLM